MIIFYVLHFMCGSVFLVTYFTLVENFEDTRHVKIEEVSR